MHHVIMLISTGLSLELFLIFSVSTFCLFRVLSVGVSLLGTTDS